jgi:hypothetical protein
LSSSSASFELPTYFQFGLSYPALRGPQGTLTVHGLYTSNSFMVDEGRLGGEYVYRKDYALRAGYKFTTSDSDLFGFTYGAGLRVPIGTSHMWLDLRRRDRERILRRHPARRADVRVLGRGTGQREQREGGPFRGIRREENVRSAASPAGRIQAGTATAP